MKHSGLQIDVVWDVSRGQIMVDIGVVFVYLEMQWEVKDFKKGSDVT